MRVLLVMCGPATTEERAVHARRLPALLAGVRERGADVTVALLSDAGGLAADLAPVATVHVLPAALPAGMASVPRLPRAVAGLRELIAAVDPAVIEGDEPLPAIAAALAARGRSSCVRLYRRHHATGRRRLLAASWTAAHLADRVVVSCATMRARCRQDDRVAPERILVCRSGAPDLPPVTAAERAGVRAELGIDPEAGVIVALARLRHEKGLDVLLDAAPRLRSRPVEIVVAGDGPEAGRLRRQAAASGLRVHLPGHRGDVHRLLAIADVVAIPSRTESFGRATVEAMAAGVPIVASRVGGLTEAVGDGETGVTVAPEDPAALARGLDRLLADAEMRSSMGRAGRERYEALHSLEAGVDAWWAAWCTARGRVEQPA